MSEVISKTPSFEIPRKQTKRSVTSEEQYDWQESLQSAGLSQQQSRSIYMSAASLKQ